MTPIEIRKENARRAREARRVNPLPPQAPPPDWFKAEMARIKAELAKKQP